MLGREQEEGESDRRERRHRRSAKRLRRCSSVQHMRSIPPSVTTTPRTVPEKGDLAIVSISSDSFRKDGRTISVGDCALFKPPQDSPPFIGIIRHLLTFSKENSLQLRVNWLYRPAELKLGKSILLDAAPNEIFYSFHTDEIPAASLLHPCRVAFLPRGVELPSGISSFVCRRVYDITNKCLWWLTDQDYVNERQEEVDQLLHKTKIEMHATVQPGGRSPKPINGPTSTSQPRPGSDNVQNMSSFTSQGKGRKRERGDQGSDPVKRERYMKMEDGDSGQSRTENYLKSEIAKITEKGGLVDSEGVEKLVHLMQQDKAEKKIDLVCRSMLAGVIAATDKFDCLNRFVQLRGLPVLDEWLQDVHKGKIGDASSSKDKDGDKSVEEFLLVLLRALDKLPVNLHALQMCYIGRSVNHLRSHKNSDIHKKARSLVDTWKKRVEAEMNIIDAKSGSNQTVSWPSKSRLPETPNGGNKNSAGSGDVAWRSSVTQLGASKTSSNKASPGEHTKSASSSPGPVKSGSSPTSVKESQPKIIVGGVSDVPITSREDKSSSPSQSHNYGQSISVKEDPKSSTSGSVNVSKVSSSGSRHRKSMNGFPAASVTGGLKETGSSRGSSVQRSSASEKLSQSGLTAQKAIDVPVVEGSSHKLIVKIPNRGRSPAQSANDGSFEDPSVMSSQANSPVLSDKHEEFDHDLKDRSDAYRANVMSDGNTESWQSNDVKDNLIGSNDGDGSPTDLPGEERVRTAAGVRKVAEVSKAASSYSGNELKSRKLYDASLSSINALIESCVKYSEANASMSIGDDVGMNLLASVAAGEISKSDLASPTDSPQRNWPTAEEAGMHDDARSKTSSGDNVVNDGKQPNTDADGDDKKHDIASSVLLPKDESCQDICASPGCSADKKHAPSSCEEKLRGQPTKYSDSSSMDLQTTADQCMEGNEKLDEMKGISCLPPTSIMEKEKECEQSRPLKEENAVSSDVGNDGVSDAELGRDGSSGSEVDTKDAKEKVEISPLNHSSEYERENDGSEALNSVVPVNQKSPSIEANGEALPSPPAGKDFASDNADELKVGDVGKNGFRVLVTTESGKPRHVQDTDDENMFASDSVVTDKKRACLEYSGDNKVVLENQPSISAQNESPVHTAQDCQKHVGVRELKPLVAEGEECSSATAEASSSCVAGAHDMDSKVKFDLNEGFVADDGKCVEPVNVTAPAVPSSIQVVNPLPFVASSVSASVPAPVAVAAAAKGPFVPLEDLLRSKGELGWKGSAATSAFRPAEPRKVVPVPATNMPFSDAFASKQGRALLDIDLNVPDERVLEDFASRYSANETCSSSDLRGRRDISHSELKGSAPCRSSGGLDLDLNRTDEPSDMGLHPTSSSCRPETYYVKPVKSLTPSKLPTSEVRRDFDLNNGPSVDDTVTEQPAFSQHTWGSMHTQPPVAGLRVSNPEIGNFSPLFPPGNAYSTVTVPSILSDRVQQPFPTIPPGAPQRILGPTGSTAFTPDVYRGSVLSSSPAVPFPSGPFQYSVYPFGSSFPLPSGTFSVGSTSYLDSSSVGRLYTPPINSQLLGSVDAVSSHYPRPYLVSHPEGSSASGAENSRKWSRQGFDLNAGPGCLEVEGREEVLPIASSTNQPSGASLQCLAQEQGRIYPVGGGPFKRKDPDGGWDNESFRYKQSSWQ